MTLSSRLDRLDRAARALAPAAPRLVVRRLYFAPCPRCRAPLRCHRLAGLDAAIGRCRVGECDARIVTARAWDELTGRALDAPTGCSARMLRRLHARGYTKDQRP